MQPKIAKGSVWYCLAISYWHRVVRAIPVSALDGPLVRGRKTQGVTNVHLSNVHSALRQELSGTHNHWYLLKSIAGTKWEAYCGTNRRRIAVQIGGVLRRFPFSEAQKPARHSVTNGARTAVQIRGVLPVLFRQVIEVGGS